MVSKQSDLAHSTTHLSHKPLFLFGSPSIVGIEPVTVLILGILVDLAPAVGDLRVRKDMLNRRRGSLITTVGRRITRRSIIDKNLFSVPVIDIDLLVVPVGGVTSSHGGQECVRVRGEVREDLGPRRCQEQDLLVMDAWPGL